VTVVVAPAAGALVVVDVEGTAAEVEGEDAPVVVVGTFADWCPALEQLAATIATVARANPVEALLFTTAPVLRRCPGVEGGRLL
jgi:thiol-disulfide isomerase/thioredoxin